MCCRCWCQHFCCFQLVMEKNKKINSFLTYSRQNRILPSFFRDEFFSPGNSRYRKYLVSGSIFNSPIFLSGTNASPTSRRNTRRRNSCRRTAPTRRRSSPSSSSRSRATTCTICFRSMQKQSFFYF